MGRMLGDSSGLVECRYEVDSGRLCRRPACHFWSHRDFGHTALCDRHDLDHDFVEQYGRAERMTEGEYVAHRVMEM